MLDILHGERPYPVPPIRPIHPLTLANQQARTNPAESQPDSERPQTTEASQSDGSLTAAAAPKAPAKITEAELALYTEELSIYKEEKEQYRLDRLGLAALWNTMEQTVAREHLQRLTSESDNEVERYQKLKADMKPSIETRMNQIEEKYQKLAAKPANQSVSSWLSEWQKVLSVCAELKMTQYTGYMGTRSFLTALKKIEPQYANIRLDRLLEDNKLNVFDEISRYQRHWESLSQKEQKSIFTTFKGQSSNQSNSDSANQNRGIKRLKRDDCPCGEKHLFDKCPYVIESMRPREWKPNPDIAEQFEKIKQNPKVKQAMDAAIKRANQNQNQEVSRTAMTIIKLDSAVFSMERNSYELRDSWIVDSGADINICNDQTRFLTYEPVEGEYTRFSTTEVKIHGYGKVELRATKLN